jgi:elongation factor 2
MVRKEFVAEEVQKLMYDLNFVRNIAIVAHVDHGKTTMTDSLVARAGLISKELAGEQRVMDFDEQEQTRGITIKAAYISLGFDYHGHPYVINLIDTPGHVDFGGHVTRAMRAVDGVILVVDSVEGIMPQTETVLRQALKEKSKPTVFINKIDRLINELKFTPQQTQERLAKLIGDINRLIERYAPDDKKEEWKINVEKGNISFGSAFNKWATSFAYMKAKGVSFKDIYELCSKQDHKALLDKAPIDEVLLTMVIEHVPNPAQAQKYRIPVLWHGDINSADGKAMINCDPKSKVCGIVFGVVVDKHAGEVGIARILSGTVKKGTELTVASKHTSSKLQQVGIYMGPDRVQVDEVPAGNIAALVGLRDLYVGETVSENPQFEPFEQIKHYSEPVVTKSIEAKNTKDLVRLIEALRQISKEDPTLKVEINQETGEHLISGMGELHLEIIEYKISKEKGIGIETTPPIVVYRETIQKAGPELEGKSPNKHNKFVLSVEPLEKGVYDAMLEGKIPEGKPKGKLLVETLVEAGLPRDEAKKVLDIHGGGMFIDSTKGVQYLQEIMELLLKAFEESIDKGPLAKEKVIGVKVKLHDATIHEDPAHRGPAQIIPAAKRPIYAGMLLAGMKLMEPKQNFLVQAPQEYAGNLISALQGRRGEILEIGQEGDLSTIKAKLPVSETFGMSNDLRSASQGRAIWYHEYAGYEIVPTSLQDKIVTQIRERKGEPKEPPTARDFME